MKLICGLSSIALLSCLSVNSAVAAVKVTKQVSNPISPVQAESVMITDLFRPLQDTVPMISQVDQLIDQDRSGQQAVQKAGEQTKQRLFNLPRFKLPRIQINNNRPPVQPDNNQPPVQPNDSQPPVQPNNSQAPFQWNSRPAPYQFNNVEELYQRLAKRSNESYEVWFARIGQITLYMRGEIYRPWKRTLSTEDTKVYDALVRQQNSQRAQQFDQGMRQLIEADRQRQLMIRECEKRNPNAVCY
ncbi:MAG: hypothetical protein WBG73_01920 [Coleofasciculaceae cyanobacterium]